MEMQSDAHAAPGISPDRERLNPTAVVTKEVDVVPASAAPVAVGPVSVAERIGSLDLLRGVAVLGILMVNIQMFSMPGSAYENPTMWGDLNGLNFLVWLVTHVFFELKFISLFSILFGAGMVLMIARAESRGSQHPVALHMRRMGWLLVFGLAHAYLLWHGDILTPYALLGMVVVAFRKARPRTLATLGLGLLTAHVLLWLLFGLSMGYWPEESLQGTRSAWMPPTAEIEREVAAFRGNWVEQMPQRASWAIFLQLGGLVFFTPWRVGGMMLLGMALLKTGFLTGAWERRHYWWMAGLAVPGLALVAMGVAEDMKRGWDFRFSQFLGQSYNLAGSVLVVLAYASLLILWWQSGRLRGVAQRLQAVGRMAFSNYILETLLCTTIFYGHGFGLFGYAERWQQFLIVVGIWAVVLTISPWWLARHGQGPLETLWRRLTYGRALAASR